MLGLGPLDRHLLQSRQTVSIVNIVGLSIGTSAAHGAANTEGVREFAGQDQKEGEQPCSADLLSWEWPSC